MPARVFLIGGGTDDDVACGHYTQFLSACAGDRPRITCVVIDEGQSSTAQVERHSALLRRAGDCEPETVLVPLGGQFDTASLHGADAMLVCGGLTPAYAAAMTPVAPSIREWLAAGERPYAGFSAGAAIAATRAVVGGWRLDGVPICPTDSAEDLDELSVVGGLGLTPFAVDVHCAPWGTLSRLVTAVSIGQVPTGVGLDEDTMLTVAGTTATVTGLGRAWVVQPRDGGQVGVQPVGWGETVELPQT